MKCPFCDGEMEPGHIIGSNEYGTMWIPEGQKAPIVVSEKIVENCGGMFFGEGEFPRRKKTEMHICRRCARGVALLQRATPY